ncbi:MAG: ATP-binding protein [Bdellovibrionales bacterium]|nr:ATP-binding protein [Bdellovibrionales bacterium]
MFGPSNVGLLELENMLQVGSRNSSFAESSLIEFKSELDKASILTAVCAFANTSGGRIFIGVKEQKGFELEIVGVTTPGKDPKTWMSNILSASIYPIVSVEIEVVDLKNEKVVFILNVAASPHLPHVVISKAVSSLERERVYWRYNDRSEPAPFHIVERMFAKRQSETFESENELSRYSSHVGLDDGAGMGVTICPTVPHSKIILGHEHYLKMQSLLLDYCPLRKVSPYAIDFVNSETSAGRLTYKVGTIEPKVKEAGNLSPTDSGLLWWASITLQSNGFVEFRSFHFCSSLLKNSRCIDLFGAVVVFASFAASELNPFLSVAQRVSFKTHLPSEVGITGWSEVYGMDASGFTQIPNRDFFTTHQDQTVQISKNIFVQTDGDILEFLTELMFEIGNQSSSGFPVLSTEWSEMAKATLAGCLKTLDFHHQPETRLPAAADAR